MKRTLLENLLNWKNKQNRKPLIIKGARQVGKTHLLKTFGQNYFDAFHYINFERMQVDHIFEKDLDPNKIVTELSFYLETQINIEKDLLIFDEIQACPRALTALKYFCEDLPQLHVSCAGSLLGVQLSAESFPVGKVEYLAMNPMSYIEFLEAINQTMLLDCIQNNKQIPSSAHEKFWEYLKHYFVTGGLPEVVGLYVENRENLFEAFNLVREKQRALVSDYYADIAKHSGKVNAMHIDRVFANVSLQLAAVQDSSSAKFKFKGIVPGIDRYNRLANAIDWLNNAGLIVKVPIVESVQSPLLAYTKESQFKLFVFDVGLLGAMAELAPKEILDYQYGTYKGYFAENFVLQSLVSQSSDSIFNWQEGRAEVEFLKVINGEIIPVEVKSGSVTHAKSLAQYTKKYNPHCRVIFSAKEKYMDLNTKTLYLPLYLSCMPIDIEQLR